MNAFDFFFNRNFNIFFTLTLADKKYFPCIEKNMYFCKKLIAKKAAINIIKKNKN